MSCRTDRLRGLRLLLAGDEVPAAPELERMVRGVGIALVERLVRLVLDLWRRLNLVGLAGEDRFWLPLTLGQTAARPS